MEICKARKNNHVLNGKNMFSFPKGWLKKIFSLPKILVQKKYLLLQILNLFHYISFVEERAM